MTEEGKIQWHPAFCSAIELELLANKTNLDFYREYNLSSKPLQMDLLVIEKEAGVRIKNELGAIFRKHNIFEYKGPNDQLTIDDLFKVIGYGCLYKSLGKTVDSVNYKELTLTLVRWSVPRELFKRLATDGYSVELFYKGIYYIEGIIDIPIQVVVIREVEGELHKSLKLLSDKVTEQEAENFIKEFGNLKDQGDRNNADAVLQVGVKANKKVFNKLRGELEMCEALRELMKDEIDKIVAEKLAEKLAEIAAEKDSEIAEKVAERLAEKDAEIAEKVAERLAEKDAEIAELKKQLAALKS